MSSSFILSKYLTRALKELPWATTRTLLPASISGLITSSKYGHEQVNKLIFPSVPKLRALPGKADIQPDSGVGHHETCQKNGHWPHSGQDEQLGAHESDSPDRNDRQGKEMVWEAGAFCHRDAKIV